MPGQHARLSPSASKRWMVCTACPLYVEELRTAGKIKGDGESKYSMEGTEAHEWASRVLDGEIELLEVPKDFRPHIMEYARVCAEPEHGAGKGSYRMVEGKVPLFYAPNETGTVDYGYLRVDKTGNPEGLYIRDLKYGIGVPVDAEENTQLAIYAQSFVVELESWWGPLPGHLPVSIGIHQPRYSGDDSLKLWEITISDLKQFSKPIQKQAQRIFKAKSSAELEFAPSADVCQFCPAKAICNARLEHAFQDFPGDVTNLGLFSNLDLPEVNSIPANQLVSIWKHRKDISKWLTDAEEHLLALALAGTPAEGTKLVTGRQGNRDWSDEERAKRLLVPYLKDGAFKPQVLISPTQAEKALKETGMAKPAIESHMEKLTERSPGKEVLAEESDKREAVTAAVSVFSVITDGQEDD